MKTPITKIRRIVAAIAIPALLITAATASAQTQQNNQLALQLGAIQLGYTTNAMWFTNTQLLGNALIQGQKALLATTSNSYSAYVGTNAASTNQPVAQSASFRAELYQATLNALNSPVLNTNKYTGINTILVVTYNPKTARLTTNKITSFGLNPVLTTPTAVMAITAARIPDLDPGLISNAVAATMTYTTNTNGVVFPLFGPQPAAASVNGATNAEKLLTLNTKTATTQLNNAAAVAKAGITAAAKAYATGTKQWAAVPKTGPTNSVYLPNFGSKAIGPINNPQAPDLKGLANAAAAVAANAINGLGALNTNAPSSSAGLYGQTASNVAALSKSLTQAASAVQKTSTPTGVGAPVHYTSGAIGAETLGLITQVAGTNNSEWNTSPTFSILDAVVKGAVAAVGKTSPNISAIAIGISQGFYADYVETFVPTLGHPAPVSAANFASGTVGGVTYNNASDILGAFVAAGVTSTELTKLGITGGNSGSIYSYFNNVSSAISSGTNGVWADTISGAKGINLGVSTNVPALLNGVGTPVTDTIGL